MAKPISFSPDQGFVAECDVKEDEEQNVKLQQIVELLLSAGYFRARIKLLSPFDKVVGGMTWCITTCNYDVDVDILFQENSTIGQKIALTEKIVAVLPKMNCPHQIEPHQIQGLDFVHIFPVIQWLVKRAIETREEMGDFVRAYSVSQFEKRFTMPEDVEFREKKDTAVTVIEAVRSGHMPKRKYKRLDSKSLVDEQSRVQSTLLEYGKRYGALTEPNQPSQDEKQASQTRDEKLDTKIRNEEEKRETSLLSGMSRTERQGNKITASTVGTIVGMQSSEIQEIAEKYAEKQAELERKERQSSKVSGASQHKLIKASLQKHIEQQKAKLEDVQKLHGDLQDTVESVQQRLNEVECYDTQLNAEMCKLSEMETTENEDLLNRLRNLVAMNENLKRQEQQFRAQCKEELERLQLEIETVKSGVKSDERGNEQLDVIDRQYRADKEKLGKIRMLLARKNREISILQRKLDEVPTRAELSQYQRRFIELYNQVAAKHKETKQFYTLYNTLDDTKLYLNKEVNLLNSICDTFEQAMASASTKEQFLKQFEQIVDGVKQNFIKLERKKQEEKMCRDRLNDEYLELIDRQRLYYKTVKDFKEECRKNEILLSKLQ